MPAQIIFFHIKVQSDTKDWLVERCYSDFTVLSQLLKQLFINIPMLPPKPVTHTSEGTRKLNEFLKGLAQRAELLNNRLVCDFLNVDLRVS